MNKEYIDYPFTSNGVNFISRVYTNSKLGEMISQVPKQIFEKMNKDCIEEIIGDVSKLSKAELLDELNRVNDGGHNAFILLGAN